MGMFDYVKVDTSVAKGDFQTKDCGCQMDIYQLTDECLSIWKNDKWYIHPWYCGELNFYQYDFKEKVMHNYCANIQEGVVESIRKL